MNLKLTTAKLTAVLVPFVVTGVVMVSSAAADPGAAGAQLGSPGVLSGNIVAPGGIPKQGFEVDDASHRSTQRPAANALDARVDVRIENESTHRLILISTMGPFDNPPRYGAILNPGGPPQDFLMSRLPPSEVDYDVVSDDDSDDGSFTVWISHNQDGSPKVWCHTTVGTCSVQGTTVTLH